MAESLYLNVLPLRQRKILKKLVADDLCAGFYLADGTALALQLGHRRSIDFDLFSSDPFDSAKKVRDLDQAGKFELFHQDKDTVNNPSTLQPINPSTHQPIYPSTHLPFNPSTHQQG